jgi:hypothetical protein
MTGGEEEKEDNKSAYQKMVEAEAGLVLSQDNLSCILVPNGREYPPNPVFLEPPTSKPIGFTRIDFDQVRSLSFCGVKRNMQFFVVLRNGTELESRALDYAILTRFKHWIHQYKMMPRSEADPELAGIYLIERRKCLRHLWIGFEDIYTFSFSERDERISYHTNYDYDDMYGEQIHKTVASGRICDECAKLERLEMIKCKHVLEGFLLVQLTDGKTKVCLGTTQKQAIAIHARYIRWVTLTRTFVIGQEENKRLPYDVGLSRLVYDSAQEENEAKKRRKTEQPVCGWL